MAGHIRPDFGGALSGCRVLVTGHTGFKGGWMCLWLRALGAEVVGVALPPEPGPGFFAATDLGSLIDSRFADINDATALANAIGDVDAHLVIHMAAQAIVRESYVTPVETFMTNVIGTAHVLERARAMPSLKAAIVVTSDKCYENREWVWGYRENDPMGGADPYSASKGCTELLTASYRRSFFSKPGGPLLASVRAGNVFGGGDMAADRLIPDLVRAARGGAPVRIRNPRSIRPWQHVLEPVSGYLALAQRLLEGHAPSADGWNFGPEPEGVVDVETLAEYFATHWQGGTSGHVCDPIPDAPEEARILRLDITKAATDLGWRPQLSIDRAIAMTTQWYQAQDAGDDMAAVTARQIDDFGTLMGGR